MLQSPLPYCLWCRCLAPSVCASPTLFCVMEVVPENFSGSANKRPVGSERKVNPALSYFQNIRKMAGVVCSSARAKVALLGATGKKKSEFTVPDNEELNPLLLSCGNKGVRSPGHILAFGLWHSALVS